MLRILLKSRYFILVGLSFAILILYKFFYKTKHEIIMNDESIDLFKVTDKVFFNILFENHILGTISIGLFGNIVPRTVGNFIALSQGFQTSYKNEIRNFSYKGSPFHRIVKKFMVQGGDVLNGDGTGSISMYGNSFPDENFKLNHSGEGFVSMANSGPNTNGCQFFITLEASPWLNGKHVVFGIVLDGMEIVKAIGQIKTNLNGQPLKKVTISSCKVESLDNPLFVNIFHYSNS